MSAKFFLMGHVDKTSVFWQSFGVRGYLERALIGRDELLDASKNESAVNHRSKELAEAFLLNQSAESQGRGRGLCSAGQTLLDVNCLGVVGEE